MEANTTSSRKRKAELIDLTGDEPVYSTELINPRGWSKMRPGEIIDLTGDDPLQSESSTKRNTPFRLLDLPQELQDLVYKKYLGDTTTIHVPSKGRVPCLAIEHTCRKIRHDVRRIRETEKPQTLVVHSTHNFWAEVETLVLTGWDLSSVKTLTTTRNAIDCCQLLSSNWPKLFAEFPRLQDIEINSRKPTTWGCNDFEVYRSESTANGVIRDLAHLLLVPESLDIMSHTLARCFNESGRHCSLNYHMVQRMGKEHRGISDHTAVVYHVRILTDF